MTRKQQITPRVYSKEVLKNTKNTKQTNVEKHYECIVKHPRTHNKEVPKKMKNG
jgi:hypothetical protein